MVLVDGQGSRNQTCAEQWGVQHNQLPHGRVVVAEDLEFGIEVQEQVHEACESGGRVARWHGFQRVVYLTLVTGANSAVVHDLAESISRVGALEGDIWFAHSQKMGAKTANQPFDEDLEDGCRDERIEETNGGVVDVPEATNADLAD